MTPTIKQSAALLSEKMKRAHMADWKLMLTGRRTSGTTVTLSGAPAGKTWVRGADDSREETAVFGSVDSVNVPVWVGKGPSTALEIMKVDLEQGVQTFGAAVTGVLNSRVFAERVRYTPAVLGDYSPAVTTAQAALDQLAARDDTDEKVKVSSNDTTPGYLITKLVAGSNVTFDEGSDGGNETLTINSTGVGGGANYDYIMLREEQTQNTDGGTFTSGAWQTRVINTEVIDTGGDCALSSNEFTLGAGVYEFDISAPAFFVDSHQTRLYNVTDTAAALIGTSEDSPTVNTRGVVTRSHIKGRVTITGAKAFRVEHRCETTRATDGLGRAANFTTEVYTMVEIRKMP